jgi:hypothetical protein
VRGTKERSFSRKFAGGGTGKTEPDSSGWKREAAASRINQKRATRVKPSRPYFFGAEEKSFITKFTEEEHRGHREEKERPASEGEPYGGREGEEHRLKPVLLVDATLEEGEFYG